MCVYSFYVLYYTPQEQVGHEYSAFNVELRPDLDWMLFLASNFLEEISPNPEALSARSLSCMK